jgi:hypothetical protein
MRAKRASVLAPGLEVGRVIVVLEVVELMVVVRAVLVGAGLGLVRGDL